MGFKTSRLQYRRERQDQYPVSEVQNNEIRMAGETAYVIEHGDDDGVMFRNRQTGEAPFGVRNVCLPMERVLDRGRGTLWFHWNSDEAVMLQKADSWTDFVDCRTLGLLPAERAHVNPRELLESLCSAPGVKFRSRSIDGGLEQVILIQEVPGQGDASYRLEWDIDPAKGPAIIALRDYDIRGKNAPTLITEIKNDLVQIDGHWWPMTIEVQDRMGQSHTRIVFSNIEFDKPEHPKLINCDTMGIPVGVLVTDRTNPAGATRARYFGNDTTITFEQWEAMRKGMDLSPLVDFQKKMQAMGKGNFPSWWEESAADFGLSNAGNEPDLWELYVRRWILKHSSHGRWQVVEPLTEKQRAAAMGILNDCRKRATPIRSRLDAEAARLTRELTPLEEPAKTSAPPANSLHTKQGESPEASKEVQSKRIAEIRWRLKVIREDPAIPAIFESLKSRLENLLSSVQKDPANARVVRNPRPPFLEPPPAQRP